MRAVVTGLTQPSTMAFIGENDLLVLEKSTGRVQRVSTSMVSLPSSTAVSPLRPRDGITMASQLRDLAVAMISL